MAKGRNDIISSIGIIAKDLEIGKMLSFPFELTESQLTQLIEHYKNDGWQCINDESKTILRKADCKIQIAENEAVIVADDREMKKLQKTTEEIYRNTLDRAFVFLLVSSERINSAILNIAKGNYRAASTDTYYATFSAIRAIAFFSGNQELAEEFPHLGLKNPNVDSITKARWNYSKRIKWLEAINEAIKRLDKKERDNDLEQIEKRIKNITKWVREYLNIDYKSSSFQKEYDEIKEKVDPDAFYLENAIANHLYWLRIRADYRVDFESLVKAKDITDDLYIGISFVDIANYLIYNELRFSKLIPEKSRLYSENIIQGRIVDFDFNRSKITKKLLLDKSLSITTEEPPEEKFSIKSINHDISEEREEIITRRIIRGPHGHFEDQIIRTNKGVMEAKRTPIYHSSPDADDFLSDLTIMKDGSFEIRSDIVNLLTSSFDIVIKKAFETHPDSFILYRANPRFIRRYSRHLRELERFRRRVIAKERTIEKIDIEP